MTIDKRSYCWIALLLEFHILFFVFFGQNLNLGVNPKKNSKYCKIIEEKWLFSNKLACFLIGKILACVTNVLAYQFKSFILYFRFLPLTERLSLWKLLPRKKSSNSSSRLPFPESSTWSSRRRCMPASTRPSWSMERRELQTIWYQFQRTFFSETEAKKLVRFIIVIFKTL